MPLHGNEVKRVGLFGAEKRTLSSRTVKTKELARRYAPVIVVLAGTLVALLWRCS